MFGSLHLSTEHSQSLEGFTGADLNDICSSFPSALAAGCRAAPGGGSTREPAPRMAASGLAAAGIISTDDPSGAAPPSAATLPPGAASNAGVAATAAGTACAAESVPPVGVASAGEVTGALAGDPVLVVGPAPAGPAICTASSAGTEDTTGAAGSALFCWAVAVLGAGSEVPGGVPVAALVAALVMKRCVAASGWACVDAHMQHMPALATITSILQRNSNL